MSTRSAAPYPSASLFEAAPAPTKPAPKKTTDKPSNIPRTYNADAIEVLTGLDPVRKRPGMYTNTQTPNHLAQEVIDNSVDEATAGHARSIHVVVHADNSVSVLDDGRGMPVDEHPEQKKSGVEVILTTLHAGGKFSGKQYQFSGGLHGVGVSVVNALSAHLAITVYRHRKTYAMAFRDGVPTASLAETGDKPTQPSGTHIRFWPDPVFFEQAKIHIPSLKRFLQAKAVLCPGLSVALTMERAEHAEEATGSGGEDERITWCYQDGIAEYVRERLAGEELLPTSPFVMAEKTETGEVRAAFAWVADTPSVLAESYVNTIPTAQGGTHVNGLRSGMTDALREFLEVHGLLPRGVRVTAEDVWQHCAYVLAVNIHDPQFIGQTKERLSSREAASLVAQSIKDAFALWLNQNMETGQRIAELVISNARARQKAASKVVRKRLTAGPALPGKLTDCLSQNLEETELFLVEGDSAGGSARQARDKNFQAILPLRGKILNTWEVDTDRVLRSEEIHDIAVAIGLDPNSADLSKLRYGKVCILADADSDGLHIATLLCALFLRHFRPLVARGHVFVVMPPLYRVDIGKQTFYALDDAEKDHIIKTHTKTSRAIPQVTRFKGLGEMNPEQLRESAIHPDTRRLIQLTLNDATGDAPTERNDVAMTAGTTAQAKPPTSTADAEMDRLLSKRRAHDRKQWLEENGQFAELA